jgi:ABC-type ATPase involved in cell division
MTLSVMDILTDLHQKGTTIVFATQFTGLIKRYSYRVIQILNGQILDGRKTDTNKMNKVEEVKAGE